MCTKIHFVTAKFFFASIKGYSRNPSIRDHLAVQAAFIKKGGGNLNDVSLSVATVSRH
jgi:hypothetical protein